MKKIVTLILISALALGLFTACKQKNIPPVTDQMIDEVLLYNKVYNEYTTECMSNSLGEEYADELLSDKLLSENRQEIKKQIEQSLLICEKCKELGIYLDRETSDNLAASSYEQTMSDDAGEQYQKPIENALKNHSLTEDEFVNLTYLPMYLKYNQIKLRVYFSETIYDSDSKKTFDEQFEKYLKTL